MEKFESTVTITLKEYNDLITIKEAWKDKNKYVIKTFGYNSDSALYSIDGCELESDFIHFLKTENSVLRKSNDKIEGLITLARYGDKKIPKEVTDILYR